MNKSLLTPLEALVRVTATTGKREFGVEMIIPLEELDTLSTEEFSTRYVAPALAQFRRMRNETP